MHTSSQPDPEFDFPDAGRNSPSDSPHPIRAAERVAATGPELIYDLRLKGAHSDGYFSDVAAFSSRVLAEIELQAAEALDAYSKHVTEHLREAPRSRGEYAIELLTLGMVLRLYGEMAAGTPGLVKDIARELFFLRRRTPQFKKAIDFLRAGLFQLFMSRGSLSAQSVTESVRAADENSKVHGLNALPGLIEWLQATGEFEHESMRIDNWRSFFHTLSPDEAERWIKISIALFDWFNGESEAALGPFTQGVRRFLEGDFALRLWREDHFFCGRQPVEYHLGMVAAEVMNAGLRAEFARRTKRIVLVPACMRGGHADQCKAHLSGVDMTCTGCDPECNVNALTRRMREIGVQVYVVPHASSFSRWLERWQGEPDVSVTAVACLLNILAGGYEMRARGIASQCVPLDFPGCQKHWTSEDIPTRVDPERLVQILIRPEE
jgi:uncharacterized protein